MRRFLIPFSVVLLAVAAPHRAFSQSADPSDLFLNAYEANEQGEQLENSGNLDKAMSKYHYAASLLDQISRDDPNWQTIVVDYRKKRVSENISHLEEQLGSEAPSTQIAPAPPIEGELPQKDLNNPAPVPGPDLSGGTEPASPPPEGSGTEVRGELDQLRSELRESRDKLQTVESQKADLADKLNDALKQIDQVKGSETELKGELRQTQDAVEKATVAGAGKAAQDRIAQLEDALKNAEADRDAADAEKDEYVRRAGTKDKLSGKLDDALKQIDQDKENVATLQEQLKEARAAGATAAQTTGGDKQAQARIDQLEDALKSAEADRDAADAEKDEYVRRAEAKENLSGKLDDALKQIDQAKESEATLEEQLKEARAAGATAAHTAAVDKQTQARIDQLEEALKNAEADRDAASAQNDEDARRAAKAREETNQIARQRDEATAHAKDLASKLSDASGLAASLEAANQKIAALTKDRDDATQRAGDLDKQLADASKTAAKLADAQQQIAALTKDRDDARQQVDDLQKSQGAGAKTAAKLTAANKKIAALEASQTEIESKNSDLSDQLADAHKQVDKLTQDRDDARQQATALDGKLADARKEVAAVTTQRDQIAAQRDQALADLDKARSAQKRVDELLADNATLTQKLATDEKTIQDFKANSPEKDKQIADLRKEVGDTKTLLASAEQQRDDVQSSLDQLQQQYDSTSADLTELKAKTNVSDAEKQTLSDENGLLRGIVLRQLKAQAARDQAKRLVLNELAQLQVQSDDLMKQIDFLGQPVVQFTEKEKALFKDPDLDIPDADDGAMAISLAAPKQTPIPQQTPTIAAADTPGNPAPPSTANPTPPQPPPPTTAASSPANSPAPMELAKSTVLNPPIESTPPSSSPASLSEPASEPASQPAASSPSSISSAVAPSPMVPPDLMDDARSAKEAFERTDYREAERIYEKMLTEAPTNVYILSNLGVVYFRNEKWKLAEESLKKAIAVAPEDVFSWCTLGIVYYQEKRYDDAINSLTRALAINPKYAVAHNYLGITASQKGWQEAALKELETAVDLDPNYGDAYFNLAVVYAMQTPPNKDMARKYYQRATGLGAEPDAGLEQLLK